MRVREVDIVLELESGEASEMAYDTEVAILRTVESHWIRHFQGKTEQEFVAYILQRDDRRFQRMKLLYELCGRASNVQILTDRLIQFYRDHLKAQAKK